MNMEDGQKLLDKFNGVALWTALDGTEYKSKGFDKVAKD